MTYDQKQLGAVLRRCTVCGIERLMTQPQNVCIRCRAKRAQSVDAVAGSVQQGTPVPSRKEIA